MRQVQIADEEKTAAQKQAAREKREALSQRNLAKDKVAADFENHIAEVQRLFRGLFTNDSLQLRVSHLNLSHYSNLDMQTNIHTYLDILDRLERVRGSNEMTTDSNAEALLRQLVLRGRATIEAFEELALEKIPENRC